MHSENNQFILKLIIHCYINSVWARNLSENGKIILRVKIWCNWLCDHHYTWKCHSFRQVSQYPQEIIFNRWKMDTGTHSAFDWPDTSMLMKITLSLWVASDSSGIQWWRSTVLQAVFFFYTSCKRNKLYTIVLSATRKSSVE